MKLVKIVYGVAVFLLLFMAISTAVMKQIERDKWHKYHRCVPVTYQQYKCDFGKVKLP